MLVDAPCSGTGAWRRKPEGKWRIDPAELAGYPPLQDAILDAAAAQVKPGGLLVYATCSLLARENEDRAAAFAARHPDWRAEARAGSARSTAATASSSRASARRNALTSRNRARVNGAIIKPMVEIAGFG